MARLEVTDERFLGDAPRRVHIQVEIARPASAVWEELVSDDPMSFCRAITRIRWTSPRTFGVGTTRTATVLRVLRVRERYIRWDEGHRKVFVGVAPNLPVLRRFAEDYVVQPRGDDSCLLTWTAAWEPTAVTRIAGPVHRALFDWFARDIDRHFSQSS